MLNAGMRPAHYRPDGLSAVAVNGQVRFNRGLYGAHSGFRVDCSDMPEFGVYLPRMGGNLRLTLPAGDCIARYTPGRMDYEQGGVTVEVQVGRDTDFAVWAIHNTNSRTVDIPVRFGGVADKKFHREGDLGVDDPTCFDLRPEYCAGNIYKVNKDKVTIEYGKKERKHISLLIPARSYTITATPYYEGTIQLKPGQTKYIVLSPKGDLPSGNGADLLAKAEKERSELTSTFRFSTLDSFLNPIAGALAVAADGIWGGNAWLHGSIGWRTPHLGWRGAYVGDAIGRHDRALVHFNTYARNQIVDRPAIFPHPQQDTAKNLARGVHKWGTPMYSNGYICRRPGNTEEMSHYDMNLVYIDAMMRHFRATGDTSAMRSLFPVVKRHLAWEKLNFDPDGDHLYDANCCIWASDALYYGGGPVTHSSAYNCFANTLAAQVAEAIGEDPEPYRDEALAIGRAIDSVLWVPEKGHWAEYREYGGHKRLHPSAALWTVYHAVDSEIADPFRNYAATVYVDSVIPRIPVVGEGMGKDLFTISTTDWKPYSWSINNVAIAEVLHTALAYWQAGRADEAYALMKGVVADNMYLGASPLNFGQISYYDAARGECYRDFADPVGVWSRALTEGLFGIRPDLLSSDARVSLVPGFPSDWDSASVDLPDISYSFRRDGNTTAYHVSNRYMKNGRTVPLVLTFPVTSVDAVTVNGKPAVWASAENSIGMPRISIEAGTDPELDIVIKGTSKLVPHPTGLTRAEGPVNFTQVKDGDISWWLPEVAAVSTENGVALTGGFDDVKSGKCETVDLTGSYNANVSDIFNNEYLSPRPSVTTLQIPRQGIGEWCHPDITAEINDSTLRSILSRGPLTTPSGVSFAMPSEGHNIAYTTLWDNYPDSVSVPLDGKAEHIYLVLAGSTNHMQANIENAVIRIRYADGSDETVVPLIPPFNFAPIEQDYYSDAYAFAKGADSGLQRLHLGSGLVSANLFEALGLGDKGDRDANGFYISTNPAEKKPKADRRTIPGGAACLLDIPVDPVRPLASLTLETMSPDVVIGIMAVTLQRP